MKIVIASLALLVGMAANAGPLDDYRQNQEAATQRQYAEGELGTCESQYANFQNAAAKIAKANGNLTYQIESQTCQAIDWQAPQLGNEARVTFSLSNGMECTVPGYCTDGANKYDWGFNTYKLKRAN